MAEIWLTRTLTGAAPADAEAEAAFKKHALGTTFPVEIATRKTRSGAWHRRYWLLCTMLSHNLDSVEVEPGMVLNIKTAGDVHVALKYATGLYDSFVLKGGIVRLLKSTSFDRMTADEWAAHWPKVLMAVHAKFLPNIESRVIENELAQLAS